LLHVVVDDEETNTRGVVGKHTVSPSGGSANRRRQWWRQLWPLIGQRIWRRSLIGQRAPAQHYPDN